MLFPDKTKIFAKLHPFQVIFANEICIKSYRIHVMPSGLVQSLQLIDIIICDINKLYLFHIHKRQSLNAGNIIESQH